jgi:hypothetical protein
MTNEEVIEVLEKEESYMLSHGGDRQAKALIIAINKIEQEYEWIPVNERLPKDGQLVIVSYPYDVADLSRKRVMTAWYNTNYGFTCGIIDAWMPLPQPYKAESIRGKM